MSGWQCLGSNGKHNLSSTRAAISSFAPASRHELSSILGQTRIARKPKRFLGAQRRAAEDEHENENEDEKERRFAR